MAEWEGRELERRTAARMATAGFVPVLNVRHAEFNQEFDIYAFSPHEDGVRRILAQCTTAPPDSQKIAALCGWARSFHVDDALFVTSRNPHDNQANVAAFQRITLLSEHPDSTFHEAIIDNRTLRVGAALSARENAIVRFLRGMSSLRRVSLDRRSQCDEAKRVAGVWAKLDEVALEADPFARLERLYSIHFKHSRLAEQCALAEGLGDSGGKALKAAYAYGRGTFTQSALAVQTLNRVHTLIALCECSCLVSAGVTIPDDYSRGRTGPLIQSLSVRPFRHLLGMFAFELVYGWGGMWPEAYEQRFMEHFGQNIGASPNELRWLIEFVNDLFCTAGHEGFILRPPWHGMGWYNVLLLPFFAKGIGVRRLESELGVALSGWPWDAWRRASYEAEKRCRQYEQSH